MGGGIYFNIAIKRMISRQSGRRMGRTRTADKKIDTSEMLRVRVRKYSISSHVILYPLTKRYRIKG